MAEMANALSIQAFNIASGHIVNGSVQYSKSNSISFQLVFSSSGGQIRERDENG